MRDVAAGAAAYAVRYPGVKFSMIAATNQKFNGVARHQAAILHVELIERKQLIELLRRHPVQRGELYGFILAGWADRWGA